MFCRTACRLWYAGPAAWLTVNDFLFVLVAMLANILQYFAALHAASGALAQRLGSHEVIFLRTS